MNVQAITYRLAFQFWSTGLFMGPETPVARVAACKRVEVK